MFSFVDFFSGFCLAGFWFWVFLRNEVENRWSYQHQISFPHRFGGKISDISNAMLRHPTTPDSFGTMKHSPHCFMTGPEAGKRPVLIRGV